MIKAQVYANTAHMIRSIHIIHACMHVRVFCVCVCVCVCVYTCWSQWLRSLRRRSAAARLLRLRVRIPPGAWMSVCCECCALSGRGLCNELITRPGESYQLCYFVACDLETS